MADSAGHDQATVLEVPVTVQGAKHVEGSEQRQIFTETTKTTIVFGNGAVVNLSSKVAQGQCVFLRNDRTGREILCKVLEWRQVAESGYADLEFTTRDPNFWDAPVMQEAAVAAPVVAPAVAAPKPPEAEEKVLGVSEPAPDAAPVSRSGAPEREESPAISPETAATAEGAREERAARLAEMLEEPPESEDEAAQNDTKDAELLAALIAKDPKRKPKREAAPAEAKESEFDAMSEDAPGRGETSAHVEDQSDADGERGGKAKLISMLTPLAHRLHRYTYGKGAIQAGIAASVVLVTWLGFAWHSHRATVRSDVRATAALAQAKKDATAQSPATPSSSSGEVEAPAHGNNSGATPAQAAQKIQQQTSAPSVSAANVNNATTSSVPSAVPSGAAPGAPPSVVSAAPKLQVRESTPDAELDASGQPKHRHTKGPNGGETIPARIVAQPPPAIPTWAKGLDTDGVVKVDALIDEKGNLRSTKALSGPRVLQHEAERAVALWIFEPALTDGKPTATHMVLTVQFQR
jgi:outer membrane biosynthesis protein TonB